MFPRVARLYNFSTVPKKILLAVGLSAALAALVWWLPSAPPALSITSLWGDESCEGRRALAAQNPGAASACRYLAIESDCSDGVDNDSDEATDSVDADCEVYETVPETCIPTEADLDGDCVEELSGCRDSYDNDFNGLIDCEDATCSRRGICAGVSGSGLPFNWNSGGPDAGNVRAEDAKPADDRAGGDGACCVYHIATDPIYKCKDSRGQMGPVFDAWSDRVQKRLGDQCAKTVEIHSTQAEIDGAAGADYSEHCPGYDDIRVYTFGHSEPDRCDCPFEQASEALEAVMEIGVQGTGSSVAVVDIGCATWRGTEAAARAKAEALAERLRQTAFKGQVIVRANRAYALFPGQGGDEFMSGCPTEFYICAEGVTEKKPCPTDGSACACKPGSSLNTYETGESYQCEDSQGAPKTATCTIQGTVAGNGWADCTWEIS